MISLLFHTHKAKSTARLVPPLSHLTVCTTTKSNLYVADSLAAVFTAPDL